MRRALAAAAALLLQPLPPAPWSGAGLPAASVPAVYRAEWSKARNRRRCALLAFRDPGAPDARPRRAAFSGGWAVAYDRVDDRSAFGVAGSGSTAADTADVYRWPNVKRWADGSWATYGPEGGTGPNEVAYVYVAGQNCLYNVWSSLGRAHIERLLGELRFVRP